MDFMTFSLACRRVLLKAPRLILAFVSRKLAFSSYFSGLPAIFSDKMSMSSVSSWVFVKWLFLAIILTMGSFMEPVNQDCTLSFNFKVLPLQGCAVDTLLYTGYAFKCAAFDKSKGSSEDARFLCGSA